MENQNPANEAEKEFREVLEGMLMRNAKYLDTWLVQVAATRPSKALELYLKAAEFVAPKLKSAAIEANINFDNMSEKDLDRLVRELVQ